MKRCFLGARVCGCVCIFSPPLLAVAPSSFWGIARYIVCTSLTVDTKFFFYIICLRCFQFITPFTLHRPVFFLQKLPLPCCGADAYRHLFRIKFLSIFYFVFVVQNYSKYFNQHLQKTTEYFQISHVFVSKFENMNYFSYFCSV